MSSTSSLDAVRPHLKGSLLLPADAGYDAARQPWNLAIDQRPAAVAVPADVDDLSALLDAARGRHSARRAAERPRCVG